MLKKSNSNGFSLIEVLVAMAILSVGMLGTAALLVGIIRGNQVSRSVTIATALAQEKMEGINRLGYSSISSENTTVMEDFNSIPNYPNNKRVTKIFVDTPRLQMKTVSVAVYRVSSSQPVILNTILVR